MAADLKFLKTLIVPPAIRSERAVLPQVGSHGASFHPNDTHDDRGEQQAAGGPQGVNDPAAHKYVMMNNERECVKMYI